MVSTEPLSRKEILLIKGSWEKILENKIEIRKSFYSKIMEIDPSTTPIFRESFLSIKSLPDSFDFMYKNVDNLKEIVPEIKRLGLKHKTYKVKPKHFPIGKEALLWTFQKYLGNDFTEELREAWKNLFDFMSENMILGLMKK